MMIDDHHSNGFPAVPISKMAMSSASITDSPNSSESVNGLAVGRKFYFEEDTGLGTPTGSLFAAAAAESPTKKMKGACGLAVLLEGRPQQLPRCQVEGCNMDLSDVKAYYSKHKVCILHSKSVVVVVGGVQKRFCQQCSRFHQLAEFDQEKRSCRRRLADHNERRRKPPPMPPLPSFYGASSMLDISNQGPPFLLDFSKTSKISRMDQHTRRSDKRSLLQTQSTGKILMHQRTSSGEHLLSNEGSSGTSYPCPEMPLGELYVGGISSISSCALSLLSSEPWGLENRAASDLGTLTKGNPHNPAIINQSQGSLRGFDGNESAGIADKMASECDLEHHQILQHVSNQHSHGVGLQHHDGRQDMGAELASLFL